MCIAMPSQVIAVDGTAATVESEGRRRRASTMLIPDIGAGEWVMVAAGTIIQRLTEEEARQIGDALLTAMRLANEARATTPAKGETDAGR
jgi:hydrogenase expression/formation protein HypC